MTVTHVPGLFCYLCPRLLTLRLSGVETAHCWNILRPDRANLTDMEGHKGLRAPRSGNELDFEIFRRIDLDYSTNISALQTMSGLVFVENHRIERIEFHCSALGVSRDESRIALPGKYNPDRNNSTRASVRTI